MSAIGLPVCRHGSVIMPGTFCPHCDREKRASDAELKSAIDEAIRALPPGGEMVVAYEDAVLTMRRSRPRRAGGKTTVSGVWRYYDTVFLVHKRTGVNDDKPVPRKGDAR